ncbi:Tn3 family transposase [Metabacillus niabensis]|uniref:Tn3 family transposase n=1 Tax=Metabacillus niabensis TaxID=324854 RepID=UPI00399F6984
MPSIQDTIYPRFKSSLTEQDLQEVYTPRREEIEWTDTKSRGNIQQLGLLVLIKTVQKLGFFPRMLDIPQTIIEYIASRVQLPLPSKEDWIAYCESRTCERHYRFVRDYLQIRPFNEQARQFMIDTMGKLSWSKDEPADLVNAAIEELICQCYELPVYNTLKEAANEVRKKSYRVIYEQINVRLSEEQKETINELFQSTDGTTYSLWNKLKEDAKSAKLSHLKDLIAHRDWLKQQQIPREALKEIPIIKIKQMAAEAKTLDAGRMMKMKVDKRYALAVSLVYVQYSKVLDDIAETMIKRMMSIHKKGRQFLKDYKEKTQKKTDLLVETLHHLLLAYQLEGEAEERIQAMQKVLGDREEQVLRDCENHLALSGDNYFLFLWRFFKSHRSTFFKIIKSLPLRSTNQDTAIEEAVSFLLSHQYTRKEWISVVHDEKVGPWKKKVTPLLDLSWVPDGWWRWISRKRKKETRPNEVNRRHFEVCFFSQIILELKAGNLYIEGSEKYADYREQLISWEEYEKNVGEFCEQVNLSPIATDFIQKMRKQFQNVARQTDRSFPRNEQVRIENGEVVISKIKKKKLPQGLKTLEAYIAQKLEPINVLDVLADTEHWLNWTRFFGPISGHEARIENSVERYLVNTFCYGCNLGPTQTSRSLGELDRKQIARINQYHVTNEDLDKSIQYIINAYNQFDLPKHWGDGKRASADGTMWDLYEQNLLSENHIRYGGYGGIGYYHVSDTYIALFSNFIPCGVWEGIHILDILMNEGKVDIQPEILFSDTQGQSVTVFGLSALLGIQLMPRIRNWKDLKMFCPTKEDVYEHIDELFSDEIDWKLIEDHYEDMLRVAMSIKAGKITPSIILNKLGTYSQKNILYKAFRELGRVIRTLFLLQYIADEDLRSTIQSATNKSEAFNGFTKWLFFGGLGIIAENDREKQQKMIKYNHLIANSLFFYNVFSLFRILQDYIQEGNEYEEEWLSYLSPYVTAHVNRFGKYRIDFNRKPPKLPFDVPIARDKSLSSIK